MQFHFLHQYHYQYYKFPKSLNLLIRNIPIFRKYVSLRYYPCGFNPPYIIRYLFPIRHEPKFLLT